ncbi:MAG: F0F1 ATP synthase subunit alpha, partial [Oscillospiraceae bacterium]
MELKPQEISSLIKKQIENYEDKTVQSDVGTVVTVGDGIARVYGLKGCMANELIQFNDDTFGMALNLEQDFVGAVLLGSDNGLKEGDPVKRTGKVVSVPVGEALLGRVV